MKRKLFIAGSFVLAIGGAAFSKVNASSAAPSATYYKHTAPSTCTPQNCTPSPGILCTGLYLSSTACQDQNTSQIYTGSSLFY